MVRRTAFQCTIYTQLYEYIYLRILRPRCKSRAVRQICVLINLPLHRYHQGSPDAANGRIHTHLAPHTYMRGVCVERAASDGAVAALRKDPHNRNPFLAAPRPEAFLRVSGETERAKCLRGYRKKKKERLTMCCICRFGPQWMASIITHAIRSGDLSRPIAIIFKRKEHTQSMSRTRIAHNTTFGGWGANNRYYAYRQDARVRDYMDAIIFIFFWDDWRAAKPRSRHLKIWIPSAGVKNGTHGTWFIY